MWLASSIIKAEQSKRVFICKRVFLSSLHIPSLRTAIRTIHRKCFIEIIIIDILLDDWYIEIGKYNLSGAKRVWFRWLINLLTAGRCKNAKFIIVKWCQNVKKVMKSIAIALLIAFVSVNTPLSATTPLSVAANTIKDTFMSPSLTATPTVVSEEVSLRELRLSLLA